MSLPLYSYCNGDIESTRLVVVHDGLTQESKPKVGADNALTESL